MKTYKWVVEIGVTENWVDDGFDMTDDSAHEMLATFVPYAYGHELEARVLKPLDKLEIYKLAELCWETDEDLQYFDYNKFAKILQERHGIK
jgi:hypothetical protein